MIDFEDWRKIEMRVAKIISAEKIDGSVKLIKLIVSLGVEERQVIAGIGESYSREDLLGKHIIIVVNLEPKMIMGVESQGMVIATTDKNNNSALIIPDKEVAIGALIT